MVNFKTNVTSLSRDLGRDAHGQRSWASRTWLQHTVGYRHISETRWCQFYIFLLPSSNLVDVFFYIFTFILLLFIVVIITFTKFVKLGLFQIYFQISRHKVVHKPRYLSNVCRIHNDVLISPILVICTFSHFDQFCQELISFINLFKELTFGFVEPHYICFLFN